MKWTLRVARFGPVALTLYCDLAEALDTAQVVSRSIREHVWIVSMDGLASYWVGPNGVEGGINA